MKKGRPTCRTAVPHLSEAKKTSFDVKTHFCQNNVSPTLS